MAQRLASFHPRPRPARAPGWLVTASVAFALPTLAGAPRRAFAQAAPTAPASSVGVAAAPASSVGASTAPASATAAPAAEGALGLLKVGGYVEAFYQWNFARPGNGITNYRGFDNRHNAFTLSNAALGASWQKGPVSGEITLQIGHTPNTYYANEPASPGASGAGEASGATTWKYLQQAYLAYRAPLGRGLLVQAGLLLSPVGHEAMAVKDNWTWSRSNLFTGLPFYHTGVRATYELDDAWSVTAGLYNGWNSVVDNNRDKSLSLEFDYKVGERAQAQFLYFGGVERPEDAPEGQPWRHAFDAFARIGLGERFDAIVHGTAGIEAGELGTSRWFGLALSGRYRAADWLYLALRVDYFRDKPGSTPSERASPIFWPGDWVSSATTTLDFRPTDGLSVRLEYRHDQADVAMYFRPRLGIDASGAAVPNARSQDTITLGATAWF